jgi:hypothetical protein
MTFEEHLEKARCAKHLVILGEESVIQSWARDIGTFGSLAAITYANHHYLGGSAWIYAAIAFSWLIWVTAKATRKAQQHTMTAEKFRELCKRIAAEEGHAS